MCGLFGLIRHAGATAAQHAAASDALRALGHLAMERGTDSSGIATYLPRFTFVNDTPTPLDTRSAAYDNGPFSVLKAAVKFSDLATAVDEHDYMDRLIDEGRVVLGHTRWATQGNKTDLANCSPMAVGHLIGTHNGDVTTHTVPNATAHQRVGSTDTEVLYQSVDRGRHDRRKIVNTLKTAQGRIALAWMDISRPNRVYLARGALSPLAMAWDGAGNLYWASNPGWFRTVAGVADVTFTKIIMVREGTLLTIDISGDQPVVADRRSFTPVCRAKDERSADVIVWRGFIDSDTASDKAQRNRRVAKPVAKPVAKVSTLDWTPRTTRSTEPLKDSLSLFDYTATRSWETEPEAWDPKDPWNDAPDHTLTPVQDEAVDALLEWADTGENPKVLAELEAIHSGNAAMAFANKYRLSGVAVVYELRAQMRQWVQARDTEQAKVAQPA